MAAVVTIADEQRAQLAVWRDQYKGRPAAELQRLLLLALEREQLVAVAYRDTALSERLAELEVPEAIREAFRQALAWAWRDEQQHTVFTRGLLLGGPKLHLRARAWLQVINGAVAGWAAATQHHARWRRAPIARAVAGAVTGAGYLVGKVPRSVRRRLRHLSFVEYCRMQHEAEISASVCWERMAALAQHTPGVDPHTAYAFHRMWQHEECHRTAFEVLGSAVDTRGVLLPGLDATRVVSRLRSIAPMFVPRGARGGELASHPLGAGGRVEVVHGTGEGREAVVRAIEAAGLLEVLRARSAAVGRPVAELCVLIKPSFMLAYDRRDRSVFTDPVLVDAVVRWLRSHGVQQVTVGEAPNLYDRFFSGRSVAEVASYLGMVGEYGVVDLTAELAPHEYRYGLGPTTISSAWRDADVRIAFPKLRSHPIDFAHLCLGGLEGIAGRIESYLFAERRAERETATVMPLVEFPPHFAIIDGWDYAGDGLVGMIACRNPPRPRRIWAGRDALAVDIVAMRQLGLPQAERSPLIATALTWFGDPRETTRVTGVDEPLGQWRHPYATSMSSLLALLAYPIFQHAGGRGAVFAPPMDSRAFSPRAKESWLLRMRRSAVRRMLGITQPSLPLQP